MMEWVSERVEREEGKVLRGGFLFFFNDIGVILSKLGYVIYFLFKKKVMLGILFWKDCGKII